MEANHVLEARRGHGQGHVNFYRILREEDGLPVPHKREKKVKSQAPSPAEKVKSETANPLESLSKAVDKVVNTKERKDKEEQPVSLSSHNGAHAPEGLMISPEMMEKFGLRYTVEDWPPTRRAE